MEALRKTTVLVVLVSTQLSGVNALTTRQLLEKKWTDQMKSISGTESLWLGYKHRSSVRPVLRGNATTYVYVSLTMRHVEAIDEGRQTATVHAYFNTHWINEQMKWTPAEFNGTEWYNGYTGTFWLPDIFPLNAVPDAAGAVAHGDNRRRAHDHLIGISHTGHSFQHATLRLTVACKSTSYYYPFDTMACPIVVGSWYYTAKEVQYMRSHFDVTGALWYEKREKLAAGWHVAGNEQKGDVVVTRTGELTRVERHARTGELILRMPAGSYRSAVLYELRFVRANAHVVATVFAPLLFTVAMTLFVASLEDEQTALLLQMTNAVCATATCWHLLRAMPRNASKHAPRIMSLLAVHYFTTVSALVLYALLGTYARAVNKRRPPPPVAHAYGRARARLCCAGVDARMAAVGRLTRAGAGGTETTADGQGSDADAEITTVEMCRMTFFAMVLLVYVSIFASFLSLYLEALWAKGDFDDTHNIHI